MEQAECQSVWLEPGLLFSQHCLLEGSSSLPDIVEIPKLFGHFQLYKMSLILKSPLRSTSNLCSHDLYENPFLSHSAWSAAWGGKGTGHSVSSSPSGHHLILTRWACDAVGLRNGIQVHVSYTGGHWPLLLWSHSYSFHWACCLPCSYLL